MYICMYVRMYVPVLIFPQMKCHFLDQAKYPVYQQHPVQIIKHM